MNNTTDTPIVEYVVTAYVGPDPVTKEAVPAQTCSYNRATSAFSRFTEWQFNPRCHSVQILERDSLGWGIVIARWSANAGLTANVLNLEDA